MKTLTPDKVKECIQELTKHQLSASRSRSHIQNIKNNVTSPICPKCGQEMVLRTAKKGKSIGQEFWGCSGFPKCNFVKKVI